MTLPWRHGLSPRMTIDADFTTMGLPGQYRANLDLRPGMFSAFTGGIRPVMAAVEMAKLLADLAQIGDADTQIAVLGWSAEYATDQTPSGTVRFRYAPAERRDDELVAPDNGLWYTLPATPGWSVDQLPALTRVRLAQLRHATLTDGDDPEQIDDAVTLEGFWAAYALGELAAGLLANTVIAVSENAAAEAVYQVGAGLRAGLDDAGLNGAGQLLDAADLAARIAGYHLSTVRRYIAVTINQAEFDALNAELGLPRGKLGRWKGEPHAPQTINLGPDSFTRSGSATYQRALAFVQRRRLAYIEYRETSHQVSDGARPKHRADHSGSVQTPQAQSPGLSLDRIAALLNELGIDAFVDGTVTVATIYIGTSHEDDFGSRYQLLAGPGQCQSPWADPIGVVGEFGVARDDDGQTDTLWTAGDDDTEQTAADAIAAALAELTTTASDLRP